MSLLLLTLIGALLTPSPESPCEGVTEQRARARLCMDPTFGLSLSGAAALGSSVQPVAGLAQFSAELRLSGDWETNPKLTTWLHQHRVAGTSVKLSAAERTVRATAYEGHWRRHVSEPYLSLPTTPPYRLPFPFDVALDVSAVTFERHFLEGPGWTLEPLRAAVMLDLLRSSSNRLQLAIGPELHYVLRHDGTLVRHDVAPFSGGLLYVWLASEDGRWMLSLRGALGAALLFDAVRSGVTTTLQGRVELGGERVLLAINDQPLSLTLNVSARLNAAGPALANDWSASLGLSLRLVGSR